MSSKKSRYARGIIYSKREESAVAEINTLATGVYDANFQVGEIVASLVFEKGGTAYGDETLDRLARHPSLLCSREHLRRCWQFHRLVERYGTEIAQISSRLKYSHLYQLSRLLDIRGDEDAQRDAVLATAKKANDERLTVTGLQDCVTTHLKSIRQASICRVPATNANGVKAEENIGEAYKALLGTTDTVALAAERIASTDTIQHIAELRMAINQLGRAYLQLVARLVAIGDEDATTDARTVGNSLSVLIKVGQKGEKTNG